MYRGNGYGNRTMRDITEYQFHPESKVHQPNSMEKARKLHIWILAAALTTKNGVKNVVSDYVRLIMPGKEFMAMSRVLNNTSNDWEIHIISREHRNVFSFF